MQPNSTTIAAVILAVCLGACTDYGVPAVSGPRSNKNESAATEEGSRKTTSAPGDDDDDDAEKADDEVSEEVSEPAPGSGGTVKQVAKKFAGSKVFLPARTPAPGLLMLHGSEGGADGTIEEDAKFLAGTGLVVVTLCWYGCDGTPDKIARVPLDRTIEAGRWLASTVEVGGRKVGLFGWSRGAEQAVLIGSLLESQRPFATIAVHAASDTVVSSFDPKTESSVMEEGGGSAPAPAWTFQGRDLHGEKNPDDFGTGPRIQIEKYPGALFVSHGVDDQLWEVARSKKLVASRERVSGRVTEAHFWEGEDHTIATQATQDRFDAAINAFFVRELGL